jgi:predicted MFS family arabinose efflux permease
MPDDADLPEGHPGPGVRDVLGNRSAVALLLAMTLATMASTAQFTALGKFVFDSTRRPLDLGLIGLAEFLPAAVLVVVSGALADRFDRRRVAAFAFFGEASVVVALAAVAATTLDGIALVLGVVVAFGTFRALGAPSGRSLPAMVVPPETVPRMMAFFAGSWQVGLIAGPVLGGFLYVVSPSAPFIAAAGLLLVAGLLLLTVKYDPAADLATDDRSDPADRPGLRSALEGLRFVRRTPILLGAISLDLFAVLFGGAVALLPAIATDRLGVGAVGLGWLRAAGGIGAALTTAYLAARPLRRHVGRTLFVAVAVFGVATIALGLTRTYVVAFAALLLLSAADAVSVFVRVSIIPLVTPNEVRGRVFAVENVFIGASNELGAFESGVAAALIGVPGAVVLGGVATLAVVGLWSWWFPALRDVDHFADLGGTPTDRGTTIEAATAIEAERQDGNPL